MVLFIIFHLMKFCRNVFSLTPEIPCPPLIKGAWGDFREGLEKKDAMANFKIFLTIHITGQALLEQSLY
jgi:hypothetical protein